MKKWTTLDTALTPDGKTVALIEHDGSYSIRIDNTELMSTRRHASEERIAQLACRHAKRVLIGGLGFGFTLKAALAVLPDDATVVVAEIMPEVVAWNQNPAYPLAADAMADPRVTVLQRDVGDVIRESAARFDSIVMDVDNGPAALSADSNARLYDLAGLRLTRAALHPGGCAAFWSAATDPAFEKRMASAGFSVEVHRCRPHTIFLGTRA